MTKIYLTVLEKNYCDYIRDAGLKISRCLGNLYPALLGAGSSKDGIERNIPSSWVCTPRGEIGFGGASQWVSFLLPKFCIVPSVCLCEHEHFYFKICKFAYPFPHQNRSQNIAY